MRSFHRRRQASTFSRIWPGVVAAIVAINLLLVARSVINKIPQGDIKVVTRSDADANDTAALQKSTTSSDSSPKPTAAAMVKQQQGTEAASKPPSCRTEMNAEFDGADVIKDGWNLMKNTSDECCRSCAANKQCNVWVFCAGRGKEGCGWGREFGECWLKNEPQLDVLKPRGRRGANVPWISGLSITDAEYETAKNKVENAAKAEFNRLAVLRANTTLPLVFFDVEIKEKPIGRIEMVLFSDVAPRAAENFRQLCTGEAGIVPEGREGAGKPYHYKGAPFYRIIDQFIDQSGVNVESVFGGAFKDDPLGLKLKHDRKGLLSIAHLGPDTATAHFSIMMGPAPHLDGHHTVFGQVVTGFDVIEAVNALSLGKPENTATAEDGAKIVEAGQIRKGSIVPDLTLGL